MADEEKAEALAAPVEPGRVVRRLDALGWRREGPRRIGGKAATLAKLQKAGLPLPESWVIEARWFDDFLERSLPRKHDLRSLIKLAGSAAGEERCARAYEELLAAPLPDELVNATEAWWHSLETRPARGIAVRPSLAASGERAGAATRHMHSLVVGDSPVELVQAIRKVWASAVLSCTVEAYAEAGLREASLALLLQRAVPTDLLAWLTRTVGAREAVAKHGWHLGMVVAAGRARARAMVLAPLGLGQGGEAAPAALAPLFAALEPAGFELLGQIGAAAEKELGPGAVVCFAVERGAEARVHVISADESPRWRVRGDDDAAWVEVLLASDGAAPPRRLGQSLAARAVRSGVVAGLRSVGASVDDDARVVGAFAGRTYLNLDVLCQAGHDIPATTPEDMLRATGTASAELLERVAGRSAAKKKSRVREALVSSSMVMRQLRLQRSIVDRERQLQREARALAEMDLTLLPTDGMSTTLLGAEALLERTVELWSEIAATELGHEIGIRAILRRHVPDAHPLAPRMAMSGVAGSFGASLALALGRVVDVFRGDDEARARLGEVRQARDLPDGPARGALGQFLASYGDVARGPFELSRPRWREDASDPIAMVRLWLTRDGAGSAKTAIEAAQERVRAMADGELARFEPDLGRAERAAVRLLIDRGRAMARSRSGIDRLLYRVLALFRQVVVDADRRLRRIDPSSGHGGAFDCSLERLAASFKSGRPELRRVVAMRQVERALQASEPAPPLSFVGSPPRVATPLALRGGDLSGIGVSPGVVDGRVRFCGSAIPERVAADDILVVPSLEGALAPIFSLAGAVISESGGALSPGAEALRELAIPGVASLQDAGLVLAEGERLRVDGERGAVQRLGEGARA